MDASKNDTYEEKWICESCAEQVGGVTPEVPYAITFGLCAWCGKNNVIVPEREYKWGDAWTTFKQH